LPKASETDVSAAAQAFAQWQQAGGIDGFSSVLQWLDHTQSRT
jgi:hypothetical protein